ncbi:MAG: hypothetical protein LBI85_08315 [Spirochaetaceae bacterium]|nr:hypothetical protein [Spirochaetaceae bacterium]
MAALLVLCYRYIFVMYERVFVSIQAMRLRRPRQGTLTAWRSYTAVSPLPELSAGKPGTALRWLPLLLFQYYWYTLVICSEICNGDRSGVFTGRRFEFLLRKAQESS